MSSTLEVTVSGLSTRTYLRYEALSNLKLSGDQRDVSDEFGDVAVSGYIRGAKTSKPGGALPIGLYEYYPDDGVFAPAFIRWEDRPRRGAVLATYQKATERTAMVGLWGIRHLIPDRSVWNQLGTAVEMVLAGADPAEVKKSLDEIARRALGQGSYQAFAGEEVSWNYHPLIQIAYDLKQTEAGEAAASREAPSQEVDAPGLSDLLYSLLYDAGSPLYKGVSIKNVVQHRPLTDSPTSGTSAYTLPDMVMQPDHTKGTMGKRMEASGATSGDFDPSVLTALIHHNSTKAIKKADAVILNAVTVMANDPSASLFVTPRDDPKDKNNPLEIPFDFSKKEVHEIAVQVIEGPGNDPNDPLKGTQLPGRYGKILLGAMGAKVRRGKTFSKAMGQALSAPGSIARVRPLTPAITKIVKLFLRTKL